MRNGVRSAVKRSGKWSFDTYESGQHRAARRGEAEADL